MSDIAFVFPPSSDTYDFLYHLGTGYIRSYTEQYGIKTVQVLPPRKMTLPDIVKDILMLNPEIVGFTCYDENYAYVKMLASMIKKKIAVPLVVGGPTATFSTTAIMEHTPEIDICVRGEGEKTMLELVQKGCSDLESINGISYRSGEKVLSTPERPLISGGKRGAELDVLPSPYTTGVVPPDGRAGMLTARGCVYQCTYCNFSIMFGHTIRYHSVDRVIEELHLINEHWDPKKAKFFEIHDDAFSLNVKRAKTICQKIIDEKIMLPISLETRADHCDKELIELMRGAGVQKVNFGLESAVCSVLRTVKKSLYKEKEFLAQVKTCVTWARNAGITPTVSAIFGLPGEGVKKAEETLNFIKTLQVDTYYHDTLCMFAGTELFRTRKKYNLDVYATPFFLPRLVQYAYDIKKVTPLPHAHLYNQWDQLKKVYSDIISYRAGRLKTPYEYVIIKAMPHTNALCTWLKTVCAFPFSVLDVTPGVTKETGMAHLSVLAKGGAPVGLFCIATASFLLRLLNRIDQYIPVPFKPFHKRKGAFSLLTIETSNDVKALAHFADSHTTKSVFSLSAEEIPDPLVHGCTFGEAVCPALSGSIVVIDGDDVLPCSRGGCIGFVGDSIQTLRQNLHTVYYEKEEKRGCRTCPVTTRCSHCVFPHPFSDAEFCNLKREYSHISPLVTMLDWLHFSHNKGAVRFRRDETAPPLFYKGTLSNGDLPPLKDDIRLLSVDRKAFAFSKDTLHTISLGSALAVVLEACQQGADAVDVASFLCGGLHTQEMLNTVLDTVSLLKKRGFLK